MNLTDTEASYCRAVWDKLGEGGSKSALQGRDRNYTLSLQAVGASVNEETSAWLIRVFDRDKWNVAMAIFRLTKEITVIRKYR